MQRKELIELLNKDKRFEKQTKNSKVLAVYSSKKVICVKLTIKEHQIELPCNWFYIQKNRVSIEYYDEFNDLVLSKIFDIENITEIEIENKSISPDTLLYKILNYFHLTGSNVKYNICPIDAIYLDDIVEITYDELRYHYVLENMYHCMKINIQYNRILIRDGLVIMYIDNKEVFRQNAINFAIDNSIADLRY